VNIPRWFRFRLLFLLPLLVPTGCATLQQFAALRNVAFSLDGVSGLTLAGVDLERVASFSDLGLRDVAAVTMAVTKNRLPMELRLHVLAENPADNGVDARLVQMDWTLFLQDRETLSGIVEDAVVLPPGVPTEVPIAIQMDLMDFFQGSAQDLVELALSLTGQGGAPKDVSLRATPVVDTPLGPIRYPQPITIVSAEVGTSGEVGASAEVGTSAEVSASPEAGASAEAGAPFSR